MLCRSRGSSEGDDDTRGGASREGTEDCKSLHIYFYLLLGKVECGSAWKWRKSRGITALASNSSFEHVCAICLTPSFRDVSVSSAKFKSQKRDATLTCGQKSNQPTFFNRVAPASLSAVSDRYKTVCHDRRRKSGDDPKFKSSLRIYLHISHVDGPRAIVYLCSQHILGSDLIYSHP